MISENMHLILADDDRDDCLFFKEALEELHLPVQLTTVHDGEKLMQVLIKEPSGLPHIIFVDLNMPRKNGLECLAEIKRSKNLKQLPVIVVSTSFHQDMVNLLYQEGAQYFIRKPADFAQLKMVIRQALAFAGNRDSAQPLRENFVIRPN